MTIELQQAVCPVCGQEIPAGTGVERVYREETHVMKCDRCAASFAAEPVRYLVLGPSHCDVRWHGHQ